MRPLLYITLLLLALVLLASLGFFSSLTGTLSNKAGIVGHVVADYERCAEVRADMARLSLSTDGTQELRRLEAYYQSFCDAVKCTEGASRCRSSYAATTSWTETCVQGSWRLAEVCSAGCDRDLCLKRVAFMRMSLHPASVEPGRATVVVVDLSSKDGSAIVGAQVALSASHGVIVHSPLFTNEAGQALFTWLGTEPGFHQLQATSEVDGARITTSDYVEVGDGS